MDGLKELLKSHLLDDEIDRIYNSIDTGKCGKISWNEFLAATIR